VSISFEENIAQLEAMMRKAEGGAAAVANAMAAYIAERVAQDTLTRNTNPPGTYNKARPGAPPSYGSGKLAKSMYSTPASGGLRATAIAGSNDKRARLFEHGGCVLKSTSRKVMHWVDSGGSWFHSVLRVDSDHPFLGPTTEEALDDGELRRIAIEAGRPYDP
jgi:hypothetical protein